MANRFERGLMGLSSPPHIRNDTTVATLTAASAFAAGDCTSASSAMKLSAVDRCIELISDSIGKLPIYIQDRDSRNRVQHELNRLLTVRPNEAQTPTDFKKHIEANRLAGNGYALIVRDPVTLKPQELISVPHELVYPYLDNDGHVWYRLIHPFTGSVSTVHRADMIHVMAYSHNGYKGISVLERASEVIAAARASQQYNLNYYANGGQPGGVLETEADLSGTKTITLADGKEISVSKKDLIRREWEKRHSGPTNAQRIAILDYGLKYTPISVTNRDAQFVENAEISVQDIARFFGVPLYKLQSGKQSYNSNEQNSIEYVVSTLHPIVTRYEEALTYRLLTFADAERYRIRINLNAELRGDFTARGSWYEKMRNIGAYSANDIRDLEDLPDVDGGDERYASLNYVPLSDWKKLSQNRNDGGNANANNT